MFYEIIVSMRDYLEKNVTILRNKMNNFPNENLLCSKNGKYANWYISNGKKPIYISKHEQKKIENLAEKKYLEFQLKEYEGELELLNNLLERYSSNILAREQLLELPQYQLLLDAHARSAEAEKWMKTPYEKNTKYPEKLIHKTFGGDYVRSKSEVIIANALFDLKIPYRYECALQLSGISFFPDFTILHPKTKKLCYWEHFGMMDNPSYAQKAFEKQAIYVQNGIIPSIGLITTFETSVHPINSGTLHQLIQQYFS